MNIVERILTAIIDKLVARKAGKLFTALKNDPEYQESLLEVKRAVEEMQESTDLAIKTKRETQKAYEEYAAKYGKRAADKIFTSLAKRD
jgi:CHASE3 domain sensor protein